MLRCYRFTELCWASAGAGQFQIGQSTSDASDWPHGAHHPARTARLPSNNSQHLFLQQHQQQQQHAALQLMLQQLPPLQQQAVLQMPLQQQVPPP